MIINFIIINLVLAFDFFYIGWKIFGSEYKLISGEDSTHNSIPPDRVAFYYFYVGKLIST